jgi:hypothetical protein
VKLAIAAAMAELRGKFDPNLVRNRLAGIAAASMANFLEIDPESGSCKVNLEKAHEAEALGQLQNWRLTVRWGASRLCCGIRFPR